jgi:hypothetical protein
MDAFCDREGGLTSPVIRQGLRYATKVAQCVDLRQAVCMKDSLTILSEIIWAGIARTEPQAGGTGGDTIFTGSFDWHSCVHAHWALLEIRGLREDGRLTTEAGSRGGEGILDKRLSVEALGREIEYLKANPEFEKPYGRAWLLLLLERIGQLDEFSSWLWEDLIEWLENSPFPESEDGFLGTHRSWLFCFFLLLMASGRDGDRHERLCDLEGHRLQPLRDRIIADTAEGGRAQWDFIHLPSLLAAIDGLQGRPLDQSLRDLLDEEKAELLTRDIKITERTQCHEPGRFVMQAWPFVFYDPAAADEIMAKIMAERSCWEESFEWVSHWVPQFMVMEEALRNQESRVPPSLRSYGAASRGQKRDE